MKCSIYTGLKIKMDSARVKSRKNYYRRKLREHAMRCKTCDVRRRRYGET